MTDTNSLNAIRRRQQAWAAAKVPESRREGYPDYLTPYGANLFLGGIQGEVLKGYQNADGGELKDGRRPAKMSSLLSSSALAVNFFNAWCDGPCAPIEAALGLSAPISGISFEHKCRPYALTSKCPNLDVFLALSDGSSTPAADFKVAVEGRPVPALDVLSQGTYHRDQAADPEGCEYFVPVRWLHTVPLAEAVQEVGMFGNQNTVCKPTTPVWRSTVDRLKERWQVT